MGAAHDLKSQTAIYTRSSSDTALSSGRFHVPSKQSTIRFKHMPRNRKATGDEGFLSSCKSDQDWPAKAKASKEYADLRRRRRELVSVCRVRTGDSATVNRPRPVTTEPLRGHGLDERYAVYGFVSLTTQVAPLLCARSTLR
jgi:hypothetical protein